MLSIKIPWLKLFSAIHYLLIDLLTKSFRASQKSLLYSGRDILRHTIRMNRIAHLLYILLNIMHFVCTYTCSKSTFLR